MCVALLKSTDARRKRGECMVSSSQMNIFMTTTYPEDYSLNIRDRTMYMRSAYTNRTHQLLDWALNTSLNPLSLIVARIRS